METQDLLNRWEELLDPPGNALGRRDVLRERVEILHRLNELGVKEIDGRPLVKSLEESNASLRETDGAVK